MGKINNFVLILGVCLITLGAFQVIAKPAIENGKQTFNGYKVIRAVAETFDQGMILADLQKHDEAYDFWTEPSVKGNTDIMASTEKIPKLLDLLKKNNIHFETTIEDVGRLIASQSNNYPMQGTNETMDWTKYHTLDTVYEWFQNLSSTFSFVDVINIGKSTEGRDLKVVRLSKNLTQNRPAIFIDATIHAREWISLATITYIINELVSNPQDNQLLDELDFYFLPVINPDGFEFTVNTNRMWRKTRSLNGGDCVGADANRNFDFEWATCSGCSSGVCSSETFRGETPYSEPEANAMKDFIETAKNASVNFQSYISIHSYGQYFMIPWGYTPNPPEDYEELMVISNYVKSNISVTSGTQYEIGSSSVTIYPTDGTSQDWAYGSGIFKYVFTAELRDTGAFGFLLPANQIIPTAIETWNGFKVVALHLIDQ